MHLLYAAPRQSLSISIPARRIWMHRSLSLRGKPDKAIVPVHYAGISCDMDAIARSPDAMT